MHQVLHAHQALAQLAARMQVREVLFAKPFPHEQRHGQRIANRERGRGAGGWHEVQRARLSRDVAIERDIGGLAERRLAKPVMAISCAPRRRIVSSSRSSSSVSPL